MKVFTAILPVVILLTSCATPETRLRSALVNAGLSKPVSACMAERMVGRLSIWQLNKLRGLQKLNDADAEALSVNEFVKHTKSLRDPEILSVVTTSGVICAIREG